MVFLFSCFMVTTIPVKLVSHGYHNFYKINTTRILHYIQRCERIIPCIDMDTATLSHAVYFNTTDRPDNFQLSITLCMLIHKLSHDSMSSELTILLFPTQPFHAT